MALGRSRAVALVGLEGHLVDVEADIASGLPAFVLVGLPDTSLAEAKDRVKAAATNIACPVPLQRVTVNLSPASLPKHGSGFDLAIAAAVLGAAELLDPARAAGVVHVGELGLDGRLRPVRGVLPAVLAAVRAGAPRVVVPQACLAEALLVPGAQVVGAESLADVVRLHGGRARDAPAGQGAPELPPTPGLSGLDGPFGGGRPVGCGDLADVAGQRDARAALEVAAAGGHHLLLVGPPGAGKTMLAARLPGLLPDLEADEAVEVTAIHSVSGTFDPAQGLIRRPPFEDPHHTASAVAVVGGGSGWPRPGAASRAHRGVLFLDEAPEFAARVLDALRQPLESGNLVIARSRGVARFPARFQLVLAANPCPCGRATGKGLDCRCPPLAQRRYLARLSGPLLDRVDLRLEVLPVARHTGDPDQPPETSAVVAARVLAARSAQAERWAGCGWRLNGEAPGAELRGGWRLPPEVTREVDRELDLGALTMRGYDRVLRVAWTVADLRGAEFPDRDDVGAALLMRQQVGRAA